MDIRTEVLGRSDCAAAYAARDCHALVDLLAHRVKVVEKMITERGVRAALPMADASRLIRLLKDAAESPGVPAWLGTVLTALHVPVEQHIDYAGAVASAYGWLRQDAGLDLGSPATRAMLDLIAASDPANFGATATTLKALAEIADVPTQREVAIALYQDDGTPL